MVGDRGIQLDRIIDGELIVEPYPGVAEGAGIWIDNEPWAEDEWDSWADPNMGYRIAEDAKPRGDEFIIIFEMDALLADPGLDEVKVRVTDFHENWTRSDNVLEDIDGLYTVTKVGIIEQNYQGTTVLADFCGVPVCNRVAGEYTLDYVAQVVTSDYIEPPDFLWSVINSPLHEGSVGLVEINVPIYRLDPELDRYEIYNELFPPHGYQCNVHYYSRGLELLIPPGEVAPVVIDDWRESVQPMHEEDYGTCPHLYLSDRDHLLGIEGDPNNDQWKDYSIAMAIDSDIRDFYDKALNSMYFGSSERGIFYGCNVLIGDKDSYAEDVLDSGVERLKIDVEEKEADIGIQSRGDAYFVIGHSYETGNPPGQVQGIWEFIPSANHNAPGDWKYVVSRDDFATSGDLDREVNWLISQACHLLGPSSYQYWQALIPNQLDAICGFRCANIRELLPEFSKLEEEGPSAFFGGFSTRLTSNEGAHESYWKYDNQIPNDRAIIAWMENACEWARILKSEVRNREYMMENAAAIDELYIYEIEWTSSPYDWPLFGESLYIVRY